MDNTPDHLQAPLRQRGPCGKARSVSGAGPEIQCLDKAAGGREGKAA